MLLLANPPFEGDKALRVLKETIPHLPIGAVFGFVLPQAIIYSSAPKGGNSTWDDRTLKVGLFAAGTTPAVLDPN